MEYTAELVEEHAFESYVKDFFVQGGSGLNITLPFKARAAQLATQSSERVQQTGAANTLWIEHGEVRADNTDGMGWIADIHRLGWQLAGARVVVLGAGGAVAGIMPQLLASGIASCTLCNRTRSRAGELVRQFSSLAQQHGVAVVEDGLDYIRNRRVDLLINALSINSEFDYGQYNVKPEHAYDLSYALDRPTVFCAVMGAVGAAHVADGLGMLVYQAAAAFTIWHDAKVDACAALWQLKSNL